MQLRYRIFLLVGSVFLGTMLFFVFVYYYLIAKEVQIGSKEISAQIEEMNTAEQKNLLSYFGVRVAGIESRIITLFEKLNEFDWLRRRYVPSEFNYRTNDWSSASLLLASNEWLDLIQVYTREKLTALVVSQPPFLKDFIRIPLEEDSFSIIVAKGENDEYSAYIAIPYGATDLINQLSMSFNDMFLRMEELRVQWVIFSIDQILNMQTLKLRETVTDYPGGMDIFASERHKNAYITLMSDTVAMIEKTKKQLIASPDLVATLKSKEKTQKWVLDKLSKMPTREEDISTICRNEVCYSLDAEMKNKYLTEIVSWDTRFDHSTLVWELAVLTGAGLWNFNPFDPSAPLGICSFYREDVANLEKKIPYAGRGVYSKDVFFQTPINVPSVCEPIGIKGDYGACMLPSMQLVTFKNSSSIFLVGTLIFTDIRAKVVPAPIGKLTAGVNITPILQQLALASTGKIFFLTREGGVIVFNTNGDIETEKWNTNDLKDLISKKAGSIANIEGEEYYFLHLASILNQDGHIFMIQAKENQFALIDQLKTRTTSLLHKLITQNTIVILLALLIAYVILHHVIKRATQPIQELAEATKKIGAGSLDLVTISQPSKERTDEIGMLCRAFEQMIEEMREGAEVRAILNKVVSKEVAEKILREGVKLGGEMRDVSVLFSDIRHFTHISEHMAPPAVLEMLNDCLTVLSHVIDDFEGVIDKYVGDEIMALFGAPVELQNHALQAILCAKMMMKVLQEWNRGREQMGLCPLSVGIGIHTGPVIAGNMGAENHLTYTVIGHNVNLASRLCDYAKEMEILITEETLNAPGVKDLIQFETLPPVIFRGISKPIPIFRVDPYA